MHGLATLQTQGLLPADRGDAAKVATKVLNAMTELACGSSFCAFHWSPAFSQFRALGLVESSGRRPALAASPCYQAVVPIDYAIREGMVQAHVTGVLNDATLIAYIERLLSDPLYKRDMPVVFDATRVSALELSGAGVRDASAVVRDSREHPTARVALVVSSPAAYGMARMYGLLRDVEVSVFEDRDVALAWLKSPRVEVEAG